MPKYESAETCGCIRRDGATIVWCGTWERDFARLLHEVRAEGADAIGWAETRARIDAAYAKADAKRAARKAG